MRAEDEIGGEVELASEAGCAGDWLHSLGKLVTLVDDPRLEIRTAAMVGVIRCLHSQGETLLNEAAQAVFVDAVFPSLRGLPAPAFSRYIPEILPRLCQLVSVDSEKVRLVVQSILLHLVCPVVALAGECPPAHPLRAA